MEFVKMYKETEVESASNFDLGVGIGAIVFFILTEISIIHSIINFNIGVGIILQFLISPILLLIASVEINLFKRKSKFTMYFCQLNHIIDIASLKKNYEIALIDDYGIIFVDKKDSDKISDFKLKMHNSIIQNEMKLFIGKPYHFNKENIKKN